MLVPYGESRLTSTASPRRSIHGKLNECCFRGSAPDRATALTTQGKPKCNMSNHMKLKSTVIGWTEGGGVDVGHRNELGRPQRFDRHPFRANGDEYRSGVTNVEREAAMLAVMVLYHKLVKRDGVDPDVAHAAFMDIEEYRNAISLETLLPAISDGRRSL
jgi:hypothetical protein